MNPALTILLLALAVLTLALIALVLYVWHLAAELQEQLRLLMRRPEVQRDSDGRRIKERL
jgi:hypothetical protein